MERQNSKAEAQAIKSVVIVGEIAGNDFCTGFVADVDSNATYIVTHSEFVQGRYNRLKVCFFDQIELEATVIQRKKPFCLLKTDCHARCERLKWAKESITTRRMLVFPPSTPISHLVAPSFVTLKSTEAYGSRPTDLIEASKNFFLVTCPYTQKTTQGFNRLLPAPVFTLDASALGIIVGDCQSGHGAEIKFVLSAKEAEDLIWTLLPLPPKPKKVTGEGSTRQQG